MTDPDRAYEAVGWLVDLRGPAFPTRLRPTHVVVSVEWAWEDCSDLSVWVLAFSLKDGRFGRHLIKKAHLIRRRVG